MSKTMIVDSANWGEFPGSEQDKINIVLERIIARKNDEGIEVEHIDPISIPELMHQISLHHERGSITAIVSNFGGCACGKCDGGDTPYYVLAVADNIDDANGMMRERAASEGAVLAEDLMNADGEIDIGRVIAQKIAKDLSDRFGGEVKIRQMSVEEIMELGIDIPEGATVMGAEMPKKRTVH